MVHIDTQNYLLNQIDESRVRLEGESIEKATTRFFNVGDRFILSDLKELCRSFGQKWNTESSRNGKNSNTRINRKISMLFYK